MAELCQARIATTNSAAKSTCSLSTPPHHDAASVNHVLKPAGSSSSPARIDQGQPVSTMQLGWRDDRSTPTHGASTGPSAIERLPNEVLIDIFSYLDAAALAHVAATCSLIRQVALHDGLWKPFVERAIHTLSPPVRGPAIHPLESTLPLWHPDYGMQADTIHPPSWPIAAEFVRQPAGANGTGDTDDQAQLDLSLFKGAASLHEVYVRFIRPTESLLGWWASDLPSYGMVVRVVLDMHFTFTDYHAVGHRAAAARSEAIQIDAESPRGPPRRQSPSIVCQRIYPTNRLQGLDSDMARWSDVVGFPMPSSSAVIGQGTILRRSLTQIRTDLCERASAPKISGTTAGTMLGLALPRPPLPPPLNPKHPPKNRTLMSATSARTSRASRGCGASTHAAPPVRCTERGWAVSFMTAMTSSCSKTKRRRLTA